LSDGEKTKEQLLAEIEALKEKLDQQKRDQRNKPEPTTESTSILSARVTRRALSAWVAPVILSLPALGTVLKPGEAHALPGDYYGSDDGVVPIALPTTTPTGSPTTAPTRAPTRAGRCIPVPTVAPTLGMGAAPDSSPSRMSYIALGSARALAAALG
jgi:hypothetical protein